MRFSAAFIAAVAAAVTVEASRSNAIRRDDGALAARHAQVARRSELGSSRLPRAINKRCKPKNPAPANTSNNNSNNSGTQDNSAKVNPNAGNVSNGGNDGGNKPTTGNTSGSGTPSTPANTGPKDNRLLQVASTCGPIGATLEVTKVSGPNGHIDQLNCGIDGGGWSPPFVRVEELITVGLSDAVNDPNSPFKACSQFIDLFENYAGQHGLPPILLASFAMQESSCNPNTVGGAGEQGLMQITQEKCGGAPNGNCQDPDFNIRTGAQFFADTLNSNGGDLLKSIGQYNGWAPGLTYGSATAAASSGCCRCQNNLDYIHQFVNGWCQNKNAYDQNNRLGKYFNLDVC